MNRPGFFASPIPGVSWSQPMRSLPLFMFTITLKRMEEPAFRTNGLTERGTKRIS